MAKDYLDRTQPLKASFDKFPVTTLTLYSTPAFEAKHAAEQVGNHMKNIHAVQFQTGDDCEYLPLSRSWDRLSEQGFDQVLFYLNSKLESPVVSHMSEHSVVNQPYCALDVISPEDIFACRVNNPGAKPFHVDLGFLLDFHQNTGVARDLAQERLARQGLADPESANLSLYLVNKGKQ